MTIADDEDLPPSDEVRIPKEMLPRLTGEQFRDEGFLLEANRRFFHPLGLALVVNEAGVIQVLDDRGDPEGWYFVALDEVDLEKVANVARHLMSATPRSPRRSRGGRRPGPRRLEEERRAPRLEALGYWIQPADEITGPADG